MPSIKSCAQGIYRRTQPGLGTSPHKSPHIEEFAMGALENGGGARTAWGDAQKLRFGAALCKTATQQVNMTCLLFKKKIGALESL